MSNTIASYVHAQSVHALRILRSHGLLLLDDSIYVIYRAVVIAKLTYASSAWWGFTTADDRQRLEAVIRRGIRSRLCNPDQTTLAEMIEQADDSSDKTTELAQWLIMTKKQRDSETKTYTNKGSGHGLRWQWSFVYEATGRGLSWQWPLFLDLS